MLEIIIGAILILSGGICMPCGAITHHWWVFVVGVFFITIGVRMAIGTEGGAMR
jgi:hypothetical protein